MTIEVMPVSNADKRRRENEYRKKVEFSLAIINRWDRTIEVCEELKMRLFAMKGENEIYKYDPLRNEWHITFRTKFRVTVVKELDTNNWYLFYDQNGMVKEYGIKAVQRFIFSNLAKF